MRTANINLLPGVESADPQPPVIQTGHAGDCLCISAPTGIEPHRDRRALAFAGTSAITSSASEQESWRALAEPRISSIVRPDLAGLAKKTDNLVARNTVIELANDVARLKAKVWTCQPPTPAMKAITSATARPTPTAPWALPP